MQPGSPTDISAPDALYTGNRGSAPLTPSRMFANERLSEEDPKNQAKIAEQTRQAVALYPWAQEIIKEINKMRLELNDIGSYLRRIYAENNAPKMTENQIEIEFRARELTLQRLQEMETWVLRHSKKP